MKIVVDKIIIDDASKAVTKLFAHRKGGNDKFEIKVASEDLDKETKELIKDTLKEGARYKAHLEKLEDDWKLLKLRKDDEE